MPTGSLACPRPLRLPPTRPPPLSCPGSPGCALPHASSSWPLSSSSPCVSLAADQLQHSGGMQGVYNLVRSLCVAVAAMCLAWTVARGGRGETGLTSSTSPPRTDVTGRRCGEISSVCSSLLRKEETGLEETGSARSTSTTETCLTRPMTTPSGSRRRWRRWCFLPGDVR